nr:PP2C family serine/threonine-protein phosphatase [uncultured Draconibacterium sp.]
MDTSGSIVLSLRETLKPVNQDWVCNSRNDIVDANLVAIADGLGSFDKAEIAAKIVSDNIRDNFEKLENINDHTLQTLFEKAAKSLDYYINSQKQERQLIPEKAYGTTFICAIETQDHFKLAYSGNGAIFHLKGNFIDFPEDIYYLPWCLNNYLNPHTVPENGKEALYRYFSYGASPVQYLPSILEISKDRCEYGDIIIICSDGIHSSDQENIGKDNNNNVWLEVNKTLLKLIKTLRSYVTQNQDLKKETLELAIKAYLMDLKEIPGGMDDDCSLGIVITEQALIYFKNRQKDANNYG